jgi:hypothetical protein
MSIASRLFGTPGKRWLRAQRRAFARSFPKLTHAEQCRALDVSVFDRDDALERAKSTHHERLATLAMLMDETGTATPEQALATMREWKRQADRTEQLRVELEALKGMNDAE